MTSKKKTVQFTPDPDVEEYLNSLDSKSKNKTINAALRAYRVSLSTSTRRLVPEVNSFLLNKQPAPSTVQLEKRVEKLETAMLDVQKKLEVGEE